MARGCEDWQGGARRVRLAAMNVSMSGRGAGVLVACLSALACGPRAPTQVGHASHANGAAAGAETALAQVAAIHGGAGPFAVAGYRMGQRAVTELGAQRGSFDLEVVHESPAEVQWSCIADGLQAATGVSPGKLNLRLVVVDGGRTSSLVRNRRTGRVMRFTLTPAFLARFTDVPREKLAGAGADVMKLPDEEIFQVGVSPQ
jgi:formylmethanofuran dehydrogenase subunit E